MKPQPIPPDPRIQTRFAFCDEARNVVAKWSLADEREQRRRNRHLRLCPAVSAPSLSGRHGPSASLSSRSSCRTRTAVDGEAVVCCPKTGLSLFDRLHSGRHDGEVVLYAFDLLELNSLDLRTLPLEDAHCEAGRADRADRQWTPAERARCVHEQVKPGTITRARSRAQRNRQSAA